MKVNITSTFGRPRITTKIKFKDSELLASQCVLVLVPDPLRKGTWNSLYVQKVGRSSACFRSGGPREGVWLTFELQSDSATAARRGRLQTAHGTVETPIFSAGGHARHGQAPDGADLKALQSQSF